MDEPGYRELLRAASEGRHDSAADMSYTALKAALVRFEQAGFKLRKGPSRRPLSVEPTHRKVRALWLFLHELGVVKDPSEQALAGYVKRTVKVDDLRFAHGVRRDRPDYRDRSEVLIESLKAWAMRFLPAVVKRLCDEVAALHRASPLNEFDLARLQEARNCLADQRGFDLHWWAWEDLTKLLQRPIPADLAAMPAREVRNEA
jgi:uncharacterized protein (DUF1778 family)